GSPRWESAVATRLPSCCRIALTTQQFGLASHQEAALPLLSTPICRELLSRIASHLPSRDSLLSRPSYTGLLRIASRICPPTSAAPCALSFTGPRSCPPHPMIISSPRSTIPLFSSTHRAPPDCPKRHASAIAAS